MRFPSEERFEADKLKRLLYILEKLPGKAEGNFRNWEIVQGKGVFTNRLYLTKNSKKRNRLVEQESPFTYKIFHRFFSVQ